MCKSFHLKRCGLYVCGFDSRDGIAPAIGEGAFMGMCVSGTHGSIAQGHHFLQAIDFTMASYYPARNEHGTANWKVDRAGFASVENVCFCYRKI